jgi:hypothetical protein
MADPQTQDEIPGAVRAAWPGFDQARFEVINAGHINATYRAFTKGGTFILQRLHPIFGSEVNDDIRALTALLAQAGIPVPRLVPTADEKSGVVVDVCSRFKAHKWPNPQASWRVVSTRRSWTWPTPSPSPGPGCTTPKNT